MKREQSRNIVKNGKGGMSARTITEHILTRNNEAVNSAFFVVVTLVVVVVVSPTVTRKY